MYRNLSKLNPFFLLSSFPFSYLDLCFSFFSSFLLLLLFSSLPRSLLHISRVSEPISTPSFPHFLSHTSLLFLFLFLSSFFYCFLFFPSSFTSILPSNFPSSPPSSFSLSLALPLFPLPCCCVDNLTTSVGNSLIGSGPTYTPTYGTYR